VDFELTEDQKVIVDAAYEYGVRRLAPYYQERQNTGVFDRETLKEMGAMGFFGVELPERLGGLGLDTLTAGLVLEAISASDYNVAYLPISVSLISQMLMRGGKPEVVEPWIRRMISGEVFPAIALTEAGAGSDAAHITLRAERVGDEYILTGEKTGISMATQADFAVVMARTGTVESGAKGVSAFLVPLEQPSITRAALNAHGSHICGWGTIHFDGTRVPASHLIGDENQAFAQLMSGFDYSRALIGIQSLAVARTSLDETWKWTRIRETFGHPIHDYQGVTFPLSEAETFYQGARLLCLKTLWLKDKGLPHTVEAAMCKWWGPKLAYDIVLSCLKTHGWAGYTSDLPFEQRMRDLLGLTIGDGTEQIMKMVIARKQGL
jgi:cyclohexanecarboxyl-CoA dehydrogenase